MARSKSPSRGSSASKAAASTTPESRSDQNLAIASAVIGVVAFRAGANSLDTFADLVGKGLPIDLPDVPVVDHINDYFVGNSINLILVLHCLNTVANKSNSGYWLNNFAQTVVGTFAGVIVPTVLAGGNFINAIFSDHGVPLFHFFLLWYVVNTPAWIPGCPAEFDFWGKVRAGPAGGVIDVLLGLGSAVFNTNLVVTAVGGAHAFASTAWWQAVVFGVVVGTASTFFPLNKGVTFANTAAAANAFAVSVFVASNGFAGFDYFTAKAVEIFNLFVGVCGFSVPNVIVSTIEGKFGMIGGHIVAPFGGVAGFVAIVSVVNHLFGHFSPVPLQKGFDAFGITAKVTDFFKL